MAKKKLTVFISDFIDYDAINLTLQVYVWKAYRKK